MVMSLWPRFLAHPVEVVKTNLQDLVELKRKNTTSRS